MKRNARCFTIPAESPFLKTLAAWVLDCHGKDANQLSSVRILLPNRRSCRALRDTFLEISGGRPLLLPRIRPIGDIEETGLPPDLLANAALPELPPAITDERRLLLLTRLVMKSGQPNPAPAAQLARQLAGLLDDVAREGADIRLLPSLVPQEPQELPRHWQQVLAFLHIVSHRWPQVLEEESVIGAIDRRNILLGALTKHWREMPPDFPVIAAGSTGTQPATAALLSAIARLPQGAVILPGLDREMPDTEWEAVEATHPQYALRQLLTRMDCARNEVQHLGCKSRTQDHPEPPARVRCLRAVLQPPPATAGWAKSALPASCMDGVRLIEADTLLDEARLIAVALREALETPGKTAALVTHNRPLARMVAAQMERFGLSIDDSAGRPLLATPPGAFLLLAMGMAASSGAPAALLSLLRHPLAACGMPAVECRRLSRVMERTLLRGVRPSSGWRGLMKEAAAEKEISGLLAALEKNTRNISTWLAHGAAVPAAEVIAEHMRLAEWIASTDAESGAERLWSGDDGNQIAETLARVMQHADAMPDIAIGAYPAWLAAMLAGETFRPRFGLHPRLHILSPLEARLQHYDLTVMGGLNEGSWPTHPAADPWMSRPMRHAFGLPPAEIAIGQSAHDFFMLAAGPQALLTRARKVEGKPAIPSRWLVRLETLVKGKDAAAFAALSDASYYERARNAMEEPRALPPIAAPAPAPPLAARPQEISVSDFDLWRRDPYALYAKRILRLKPLDALDEEPDAADFGNAVHTALKIFADDASPKNIYEKLLAAGRMAFKKYESRPAVIILWWPRFEAMAAWLAGRERERPDVTIQAEKEIRWQVAPGFALKGRADRIETGRDGQATVIDYKTGVVPTAGDAKKGEVNQLQLEGLMLLANAQAKNVGALEYWKLAGRAEDCRIVPLKNVPTLLEECRARLDKLMKDYADPAMPFAAADDPTQQRNDDYAHLTRRKEWGEI